MRANPKCSEAEIQIEGLPAPHGPGIRRDVLKSVEVPVFLVGSQRSGTTMLRLLLDHHPSIAFNLESEYLVSQITEEGSFPEVAEYMRWLPTDRLFRHSRFELTEQATYGDLVSDFLRQLGTRSGKTMVGATVHHHFSKLPLLWPRAKFIYLYRDGRDVAKSMVTLGWVGTPFDAAGRWLEAEREWDVLKPNLADGQWLEVQYETLVSASRRELTRICNFLGVPFSDRMYDYAVNSRYEVPDSRAIERWRSSMTKRELRQVEGRIGERLRFRGYTLSPHPPARAGRIRTAQLLLLSRILAFYYRVRDFGVPLVLQETVSRRLELRDWNQRIARRIDDIVDQRLK